MNSVEEQSSWDSDGTKAVGHVQPLRTTGKMPVGSTAKMAVLLLGATLMLESIVCTAPSRSRS